MGHAIRISDECHTKILARGIANLQASKSSTSQSGEVAKIGE